MSRPCPIDTCERPAPGGQPVCGACRADLERALHSVPDLARELDLTLSKQTSKTPGGRSAVVPLPFSRRASEAIYVLRSALVGWVRDLHETEPRDDWPDDTPASMARWLSARLQRLLSHPAVDEVYGEIVDAVRGAERATDRPAERQFAGRCACGVALYAKPGAAVVQCRDCDAGAVQVSSQLDQMRERVRDQLAHPFGASKLLARLEIKAPESTIRRWAAQGRIIAHGTDERGRSLYRIGDVLDTVTDMGRSLPA